MFTPTEVLILLLSALPFVLLLVACLALVATLRRFRRRLDAMEARLDGMERSHSPA